MTYANVASGEEKTEEFNTVLFAIGRSPCTDQIGLEAAGVVKDKSGYIPVVNEQTNVPNIYAVGDILAGKPQLTPVAIEAGVLLARRLYQKGADVQCDYLNVPTTVFTPLEYGCCGYTEEAATAEFGEENIDVYHQFFAPTEWRLNYYDRPRKPLNVCYVKVIVTRSKSGNVSLAWFGKAKAKNAETNFLFFCFSRKKSVYWVFTTSALMQVKSRSLLAFH